MTRQITAAVAEIQNGLEASRSGIVSRGNALIGKSWFLRALSLPLIWLERKRDRWILAELSERQLKDIGLTALDVRRECSKAFWRQ